MTPAVPNDPVVGSAELAVALVEVVAPPRRRILRGLSLAVRVGEWHGVVGGVDSGVEALAGLLTGTVRPESGTVSVLGHDPAADRAALLGRVRVLGASDPTAARARRDMPRGDLWIVDATGASPVESAEVARLVSRPCRAPTLVWLTSAPGEVDSGFDRVTLVDRGVALRSGSPADLVAAAALPVRVHLRRWVSLPLRVDLAGLADLHQVMLVEERARELVLTVSSAAPVVARLLQLGVDPASMVVRGPRLEDVYLQATGREYVGASNAGGRRKGPPPLRRPGRWS